MSVNFSPTNWVDNSQPAITAAQLNRMEKGIEDCSCQGNANELAIAANAEAIRTLESGIQLGSISITQLLLMAHPIGSIYSSTVATSPADLFGGTWVRIKDAFLLSAGDTYSAGSTGGSATHTLTVDEMPSHSHDVRMAYPFEAGGAVPFVPYSSNPEPYAVGNYDVVQFTGNNQPHNNMPPYLAVYMWRRVA